MGAPMMNNDSVLARFLGIIILGGICAALMFTSVFRPTPPAFSQTELREASDYLAKVPNQTRIPLTPDNQPVTRFVTSENLGVLALEKLKLTRPGRYRRAWQVGDIEIIVASNILALSPSARQAWLAGKNLRSRTVAALMAAPLKSDGCIVQPYQANGWSQGGFVLADPAAGSLSRDAVTACVISGFDYLMGVPVAGVFDFRQFPSPAVSAILLDYLRQCSYAGKTDVTPRRTSNHGVTSFPSIRCINEAINGTISDGA
jgi:hypothetical protein